MLPRLWLCTWHTPAVCLLPKIVIFKCAPSDPPPKRSTSIGARVLANGRLEWPCRVTCEEAALDLALVDALLLSSRTARAVEPETMLGRYGLLCSPARPLVDASCSRRSLPLLRVRCLSERDVLSALKLARLRGLKVGVGREGTRCRIVIVSLCSGVRLHARGCVVRVWGGCIESVKRVRPCVFLGTFCAFVPACATHTPIFYTRSSSRE